MAKTINEQNILKVRGTAYMKLYFIQSYFVQINA